MWIEQVLLLVLAAADAGASAGSPAETRSTLLLAPTASNLRPPEAHTYQLKLTREGGFVYDDARFRANVAPDGRVTFVDHHGSAVWKFLPFLPTPFSPGTKTLQSSLQDLVGKRRARPPMQAEPPPLDPPPLASGPLTDQDRRKLYPFGQAIMVVTVSGTYDLTDEYYRWMGEDPYRYEKARFLAATQDRRMEMAARAQVSELRLALHALPDRLESLWSDKSQPAFARRRLICGLWTELRRDERGHEAAAVVMTFVRTRLPATGPDGYSAGEIEACNQGLAAPDAFRPYDVGPAVLPVSSVGSSRPGGASPAGSAPADAPVEPHVFTRTGTLRPPLPPAGPVPSP